MQWDPLHPMDCDFSVIPLAQISLIEQKRSLSNEYSNYRHMKPGLFICVNTCEYVI